MGYYTPDWIHIRSEWDFFILPLAALVGVILLGILLFVYPRRFPKDTALRVFLMAVAVSGTCVLFFFSFLQRGWSCHAMDFVNQGKSNPEILADLAEQTGFPLPPETTVSTAVMFGVREYTFWYAVRTDVTELPLELRRLNYEATSLRQPEIIDPPQPETLTRWMKESGFSPSMAFRKQSNEFRVSAYVDQKRNLALFIVSDF